MIYRTSQRGTYRAINNNLDLLSWRIAQLSAKVASEKQINKPSDNPSGAATVLRTRTVLSELTQYTENVNYSSTWLTNTGNVMASVKSVLDEVYTKAEQAGTDTYNADQRKIIATEIDQLFQSIIQFGDSRYGDNYLLAGQSVETQPFSLKMRAQDVIDACENSSLWTGEVQNYGDRIYVSRPDLPTQSQNFIIECVEPGGIDSQAYAYQNSASLATGIVNGAGGEYSLRLDSTDQAYNGTTIRLVAGALNLNYTGTRSAPPSPADNYIEYQATGAAPVTVTYAYGTSAQLTYATSSGNAITVHLQTNAAGDSSVATAQDVTAAVNALAPYTLVTASNPNPLGAVELKTDQNGATVLTTIGFNNALRADFQSGAITVYLARANQSDDPQGAVATTIDEVAALLNNDPVIGQRITATLSVPGATPPYPLAQTVQSPQTLTPSAPYTLARVDLSIPGDHNDITWSVQNAPGALKGEAGNSLSVEYRYYSPPVTAAGTTAFMSGSALIVTLGTSGALYVEEFARAFGNPGSGAYQNAALSDEYARQKAVTATAQDVIDAVAALAPADNPFYLEGKLSPGNSGLGKMAAASAKSLSEGYDQRALFRVSQDGGLTWGPPQSFAASEFQAGLYYNSQLGHASLRTNLPGQNNDIVLTANYLGTWGDDVRLEYRQPNAANQVASVTVGPQNWNICVNLGTDANGKITTTADEIVALINNHPAAGALVTASLANYHEGGGGIVTAMDCASLATGEPYEVGSQTRITPLGHATGTVSFPYTPPDVKSPNLIYQALANGTAGDSVGVRYTMSADTTLYGPDALYQDRVSVTYEENPPGKKVAVVHLATSALPSCPDPDAAKDEYDAWRALYPVWSCSSSRTVTSTAGDVLEALVQKNIDSPGSALVWASMDWKDEGWDSTAKVGATQGTVWLSGGDDGLKAEDYGVALKFIPDGSALQVGDRFQVGVGWYNGDSKDLEVNVMSGYRTDMNITGDELLGANGAGDNVLDTLQRLQWALEHNDVELVEREIPKIRDAIAKLTTMETNVGTRLIRNEFVANTLEDNKYAAETILSQTEDADFTRLITDLKNAQLVYEAVLGVTGLTTKLSLLNYI